MRSGNQTHMQRRLSYIQKCAPAHIVKTTHVGDIKMVIVDWCDVPLAPHNDPTTITWAPSLSPNTRIQVGGTMTNNYMCNNANMRDRSTCASHAMMATILDVSSGCLLWRIPCAIVLSSCATQCSDSVCRTQFQCVATVDLVICGC